MKAELLEELLADREAKRAVVLVTDLGSGAQRLLHPGDEVSDEAPDPLLEAARQAAQRDRSVVLELDGAQLFLDVFNPPLRLILVGAAHIAQPLAAMARLTGFEVLILDPRRAFATAERFPDVEIVRGWPQRKLPALALDPRTALVTLTHDAKVDDPALELAVRSPAFYIGALGSRRTHAARLERLAEAGCSTSELSRIRAPVGLDIGARTPAEIAASVLAQMIESLRQGGEAWRR